MATVKGGDLIGVGGAVCVAPETCETRGCGLPAEVFQGRAGSDPHKNRVEGYCPECAAVVSARWAWVRGLSAGDATERERLIRRHDDDRSDPRLAAPERRVRVAADRADLDAFHARTGYPAHPRRLDPPGA